MDRPKLMLVDCMTGKAPQDDPRIVSCVTDDDLITTLVMDGLKVIKKNPT